MSGLEVNTEDGRSPRGFLCDTTGSGGGQLPGEGAGQEEGVLSLGPGRLPRHSWCRQARRVEEAQGSCPGLPAPGSQLGLQLPGGALSIRVYLFLLLLKKY